MKNCTPLWREARFKVKMYKAPQLRITFEVAMSKSARRCGAKHLSKSKCTKHTSSGPLLAVEMSKKCTPLWREAHVEVQSAKKWGVRTTFGRSDVVSRGRRKGLPACQKVSKTWGICSVSATTTSTLHYTPLQLQQQLQLQLHYATLHSLHYATLHYTPFCFTTLDYTTLQLQLPLHLQLQLHYITLHYTNYITLHRPRLHYITLHYATLHYTNYNYNDNDTYNDNNNYNIHYITLHYTALHYTPPHHTTPRH